MDGAHKRQRRTADLVVGDKGEAGVKRQRVQRGVAASGRKGQATQIRAAATCSIPAVVREEVAKAMQAGSALVQASLEHLQTAERSWDKWVMENGVEINKYPTDLQVLSYMSQMSRTRQRECLAQRGQRRAGGQKGSVRNYVAEMGNNLWPHKFPAFAKLEPLKQKQYWSTIFFTRTTEPYPKEGRSHRVSSSKEISGSGDSRLEVPSSTGRRHFRL